MAVAPGSRRRASAAELAHYGPRAGAAWCGAGARLRGVLGGARARAPCAERMLWPTWRGPFFAAHVSRICRPFPASLRKVERVEVMVTLSEHGGPCCGAPRAALRSPAPCSRPPGWLVIVGTSSQTKGGPLEKRLPSSTWRWASCPRMGRSPASSQASWTGRSRRATARLRLPQWLALPLAAARSHAGQGQAVRCAAARWPRPGLGPGVLDEIRTCGSIASCPLRSGVSKAPLGGAAPAGDE